MDVVSFHPMLRKHRIQAFTYILAMADPSPLLSPKLEKALVQLGR